MRTLRLLFSPSGRLGRQAFVFAAIGVYAAGVASQWLTAPGIITRGGIWPFAIVQVVLIWIWLALHAKRIPMLIVTSESRLLPPLFTSLPSSCWYFSLGRCLAMSRQKLTMPTRLAPLR